MLWSWGWPCLPQLSRLAQLSQCDSQASSQGFWDSAEGQQAAASEARQRPGNGGSLRTKHTRKSQTSGRTGSGALVAAAGEDSYTLPCDGVDSSMVLHLQSSCLKVPHSLLGTTGFKGGCVLGQS